MNTEINSAELRAGTRIHCALYSGKDGTVVAIRGSQSPASVKTLLGGAMVSGGTAEIDIIFDDGTEDVRLPECVVRGVQWRILEGFVDAEGIAVARENAKQASKRRSEAEAAKSAAFSAEVERVRSDPAYAHLSQNKANLSSSKHAAANIREDLKKHLPGIKFSVRVHSHSSVEVRYGEGTVTKDVVKPILEKYSTGYFDTLSDCHLAKSSPFNLVYGGVEHVWAQAG